MEKEYSSIEQPRLHTKHDFLGIKTSDIGFQPKMNENWKAEEERLKAEIDQFFSNETNAISFQQRLDAKLKAEESRLNAEIAQRPISLRLPHKDFEFRTLRDIGIEIMANMRTCNSEFPLYLKPGILSKGEVLRLDYEPAPDKTTHCSLVPERYDELEMSFVDLRTRELEGYSGYSIYISYIQLDMDFEWLQRY